jgi:hypothetical protein
MTGACPVIWTGGSSASMSQPEVPTAGAQLRVPGQLVGRPQPGVGDSGHVQRLAHLIGAAIGESVVDDRRQRVVVRHPVGVGGEAGWPPDLPAAGWRGRNATHSQSFWMTMKTDRSRAWNGP